MYHEKLAQSIQQDYRRDADNYRLARTSDSRSDSSMPTVSYMLTMFIIFGLPFFIK